jgi:hypothetical protein
MKSVGEKRSFENSDPDFVHVGHRLGLIRQCSTVKQVANYASHANYDHLLQSFFPFGVHVRCRTVLMCLRTKTNWSN